MVMVKDRMGVYYKTTDKGIYCCDMHFKLMNDNIKPRYIRFGGILHKQTLKKIYHHLYLTFPMKFNIYKNYIVVKNIAFIIEKTQFLK